MNEIAKKDAPITGEKRKTGTGGMAGMSRFALPLICAVVAAGATGVTASHDAAAQTNIASPGQADVADRMLRLADTITEMSLRMGNLFGGAADYRHFRIYAGQQMDFNSEFFKQLNAGWASVFNSFAVDERFGTYPDSVLAEVRSNLIALGPEATQQQVMDAVGAAIGLPSSANGGPTFAASNGNPQSFASNGQSVQRFGSPGGSSGPQFAALNSDGTGGAGGGGTPGGGDEGGGEKSPVTIGGPNEDFTPNTFQPANGPSISALIRVPEPSTLATTGLGLTLLGLFAWRRRRKS